MLLSLAICILITPDEELRPSQKFSLENVLEVVQKPSGASDLKALCSVMSDTQLATLVGQLAKSGKNEATKTAATLVNVYCQQLQHARNEANLAEEQENNQKIAAAIIHLNKSIDAYQKLAPTPPLEYWDILQWRGNLNLDRYHCESATRDFEACYQHYRLDLPTNLMKAFECLNSIGISQGSDDLIRESQKTFARQRELLSKYSEQIPIEIQGMCCCRQAELFYSTGDYEASQRAAIEARAIAESMPRSDMTINALVSVNSLLRKIALARGQFPEAAEYSRLSLEHCRATRSVHMRKTLPWREATLAKNLLRIGKVDEAYAITKAFSAEATNPENSERRALEVEAVKKLVEFERTQERASADEYIAILRRWLKLENPFSHYYLNQQSVEIEVLQLLGRHEEAQEKLANNLRGKAKRLALRKSAYSNSQLLNCSSAISVTLGRYLVSWHKMNGSPADALDCAEKYIGVGGTLLTERMRTKAALSPKQFLRHSQLLSRRAKILLSPRNDLATELSEIEANITEFEREVDQHHDALEIEDDCSSIARLEKVLPRNAAVLRFVRRYPNSRLASPTMASGLDKQLNRYDIFLLKWEGGQLNVSHLDLENADSLDREILSVNQKFESYFNNRSALAMRGIDPPVMRKSARPNSISRKLWVPISALISDCDSIFVIPDGRIEMVPWNALSSEIDGRLIERHAFCVCDSISALTLSLAEEKSMPKSLLAVGGVNYGTSLPPIPRSLDEILSIRKTWEKQGQGYATTVLSGHECGAERLVELMPTHDAIHIATHFSSSMGDKPEFVRAMLESNPFLKPRMACGDVGQPSGYLGADRLLELDLKSTKLVVLSGCASISGKLVTGEGVIGLQKIMRFAGAQSVIASHWPVGDKETSQLMDLFYRNPVERRRGPLDALRSAQIELIRKNSENPAVMALYGGWSIQGCP